MTTFQSWMAVALFLISHLAASQETQLPNLSARFKPDARSVDVFADLLVWNAQESGTENWAEVITGGSGSTEHCRIQNVNFDWNAGVRLGLRYGMRHDAWDTQLYYTTFRTHGGSHVSSEPGTLFSAFLGNFYLDNPTGAGIKGLTYEKARIQWTIAFNILDWELGRGYWIGKALSVRPFFGLKGGWIHQSIHTKWEHPTQPPGSNPFNTAHENLKNHFWGIGPSGGINMKWSLAIRNHHSFSLFGDFSGALLYGHWSFGDVLKNDIQEKVTVKLSDNSSGASMVRTLMGFGWDGTFNNDRLRFSTRLGYEMQFWLNQLQLYIFDTGRLNNLLTLQGGTLEFSFDF